LQRVAATESDRAQYVVVLTDMADTRWKTLPKIPSPKGESHVLVLLVPASANDAR